MLIYLYIFEVGGHCWMLNVVGKQLNYDSRNLKHDFRKLLLCQLSNQFFNIKLFL